MYVFERVEALAAFDLIDLIAMINVELVFAKHGNGGDLVKAVCRSLPVCLLFTFCVCFGICDELAAVIVKCNVDPRLRIS